MAPVEFLPDDQASAYGRFPSGFTRGELERYFFLDDVDRGLVQTKRRPHDKIAGARRAAAHRRGADRAAPLTPRRLGLLARGELLSLSPTETTRVPDALLENRAIAARSTGSDHGV